MDADGPVLIYDGECNLCASIVGFVLPRDRRGRVRLAARQSEAGGAIAPGGRVSWRSRSTVVLVRVRRLPRALGGRAAPGRATCASPGRSWRCCA